MPRTAVEAVRRRLATLTVPARAVASMAAIAGRRFDFDLLQSLTQHDERELLALVKELIAAQLVVEESAERFAFRHALTREAIYAELLARERVACTARSPRRWSDSTPTRSTRSSKRSPITPGNPASGQRAADYAARAAQHALALSAPREAVAHLDRAFAALERSGAPPGRRALPRIAAAPTKRSASSSAPTTTSPLRRRGREHRPTPAPSGKRSTR